MNYIVFIMMAVSLAFSVFTDKVSELSASLINGSADAVTLLVSIAGGICFWNGVMNVAKKSGICDKISNLISPLVRLVFSGIDLKSPAAQKISMNITANLFGIGNAATPIGLDAMKELNALNDFKSSPSEYMILFTILNSSSIQLLPTTVALIRSNYGSKNPMEILPATLLCSAVALAVAIFCAKLFFKVRKNK